jgi:adenylylsulfate kinase-like enzyme
MSGLAGQNSFFLNIKGILILISDSDRKMPHMVFITGLYGAGRSRRAGQAENECFRPYADCILFTFGGKVPRQGFYGST